MPYLSAQATRSIVVQKVTVTLEVSPPGVWVAGKEVTFKVKVTSNGSPVVNQRVNFYVYPQKMIGSLVGSAWTDSQGLATYTWRVPWTLGGTALPCHEHYVAAEVPHPYYVWSDRLTVKVAYPTRISIEAPDRVKTGETFRIGGRLEYQSSEGVWSGLGGRVVRIYRNGTLIDSATTGSDGTFSITHSISTPGTYTLKAEFAGEGLAAAAAVRRAMMVSALEAGSPKSLITSISPAVVGSLLVVVSSFPRR